MAKKGKKVAYVVMKGRTPGIYLTWSECEEQIHGFSRADQKGYFTQEAAETAWNQFLAEQKAEAAKKPSAELVEVSPLVDESALRVQSGGRATLEVPDSEVDDEAIHGQKNEDPRSAHIPDAAVSCN
jgi:hypothetical protein